MVGAYLSEVVSKAGFHTDRNQVCCVPVKPLIGSLCQSTFSVRALNNGSSGVRPSASLRAVVRNAYFGSTSCVWHPAGNTDFFSESWDSAF